MAKLAQVNARPWYKARVVRAFVGWTAGDVVAVQVEGGNVKVVSGRFEVRCITVAEAVVSLRTVRENGQPVAYPGNWGATYALFWSE